MKHIKYSKELLEPIVKNSKSIANVIRSLGLKLSGGNYTHIKGVIRKYNLSMTHFTGRGWLQGSISAYRKSPEEILKIFPDGSYRRKAVSLRRALIEIGVEYKCSECFLPPEWNGKKLRLQVDHINGNWYDNRSDNLRFLCPNCHSQTKNSGGEGLCGVTSTSEYCKIRREKRKVLKKEANSKISKTCKCGDKMSRSAKECRKCKRKVIRPSFEELIKVFEENNGNFCKTGRYYGVSDNAIRKWFRYLENN